MMEEQAEKKEIRGSHEERRAPGEEEVVVRLDGLNRVESRHRTIRAAKLKPATMMKKLKLVMTVRYEDEEEEEEVV
ncbi:hypothetical protein TWF281_010718 [Arthrobotrys megalospora]